MPAAIACRARFADRMALTLGVMPGLMGAITGMQGESIMGFATIDAVQEALGRRMLLENPSTYLAFANSTMDEVTFLSEIARRTGCGLLLDVNNVFVSATNQGWDARAYIDAFPLDAVGEIHLGGHDTDHDDHGAPLLIDSHGRAVADPVWSLLDMTLDRSGPKPLLIEWDTDVPDWPALEAEAARAHTVLSALVS